MKYILLTWIYACGGYGCPIPSHVETEYESLQKCETAMLLFQALSKDNRAVCMEVILETKVGR